MPLIKSFIKGEVSGKRMLSALFSSKIATPGELTQYSIGTLAWGATGISLKRSSEYR